MQDIIIDGSHATWVMPRMDGNLGGTYTGRFVFKCFLLPTATLQAAREYRDLLGSLAVQATDAESDLAFALTQLKHRIISSPPFWSSTLQESGIAGNIGDLNVIASVLDAALRAESQFKANVLKERTEILDHTIKVGEDLLKSQNKE